MKELLTIYENPCSFTPTWTYEGTPRDLYYMAMSLSRMYHHRDGEVPYMRCTADKVDLLIISKRNHLNLGWHEVI